MSLNRDGMRNEYRFKCRDGSFVCLKQQDIERWERKFDQIKVHEMLQRIEAESSVHPWLDRKSWFFTVSGYLHKLNKERDMPYESNGEVVLFPTKEKRTDRSPDYTGNVEIHGTKYKLSAWIRNKGVISGVVGEIVDDKPAPLPKHNESVPTGQPDGDLPF